MSSRIYPVVVAIWLVAAVVAVASTFARRTPEPDVGAEALPTLRPGLRPSASFETEDTLPTALAGVRTDVVQGTWTGPGGQPFHVTVRSGRGSGTDYRYRRIGTETFYLPLRLDDVRITHDPCSSCHQAQGVVDGRSLDDSGDVHQNIRPVHPETTGARCLSCHVAEDPSRLALQRGETVPLDHAYELCAQCHYSQVESWAKGAHGKRLVGWRGRRVVMGCADCHDPHDPAAEKRIPMAGLSLPGELRGRGEEGAHGVPGVGGAGHGEEMSGSGSHDGTDDHGGTGDGTDDEGATHDGTDDEGEAHD